MLSSFQESMTFLHVFFVTAVLAKEKGLHFRLRLQFPFYSVVYPLNTRPLCKSRQQRINFYALAIDLILDYWICFNNTMNQQVIVSVKNRDFFVHGLSN